MSAETSGERLKDEDAPAESTPQPTETESVMEESETTDNSKEDRIGHCDVEPATDSTFHDSEVNVDPAIVQKLSEGFMERFLPALEKSKSSITEILTNQTVLIDTLEQENSKFKECTAHADLTNMMVKAKNYHNKLVNVKRDMANLHDKAAKLKKRALKLQQQKQKEELQRAHQEERQMEREQMLTARVAQPDKT